MSAERSRRRLDDELVARELTPTRSRAKALILAGDVLVNGQMCLRAGQLIGAADRITLVAPPRFASRGGEKLAHALDRFRISVAGTVCADLGASTGGFTDCLLQHGAARVYAVDVGYGQLDLRIRNDPRVVALERTNARYLDRLPEPVDLVVVDVSFISLSLILPTVARLLGRPGLAITLIKPQFEAGRAQVGKGGVIRSEAVRREVLVRVLSEAAMHGFVVDGLTVSPLLGPAGNVEFLACLAIGAEGSMATAVEDLIDGALADAQRVEATR